MGRISGDFEFSWGARGDVPRPVGRVVGHIAIEAEPPKSWTVAGTGDGELLKFCAEWHFGDGDLRVLALKDVTSGKSWEGQFLLRNVTNDYVTLMSSGEIK